jgi:hypothetical protein
MSSRKARSRRREGLPGTAAGRAAHSVYTLTPAANDRALPGATTSTLFSTTEVTHIRRAGRIEAAKRDLARGLPRGGLRPRNLDSEPQSVSETDVEDSNKPSGRRTAWCSASGAAARRRYAEARDVLGCGPPKSAHQRAGAPRMAMPRGDGVSNSAHLRRTACAPLRINNEPCPFTLASHLRPQRSTRARRCALPAGRPRSAAAPTECQVAPRLCAPSAALAGGQRGAARTPCARLLGLTPCTAAPQVLFWKSELDHTVAEKNAWKDR